MTGQPIFAVRPTRGRVVHLHVPGYQPSAKERPQRDVEAMCAAPIWPNGDPTLEKALVPLGEALEWTSLAPSPNDPRPSWTWCKHCIGHAVVLHGMAHYVLAAIHARGVIGVSQP
jgi:hypothetical protein